MESFNFDEYLKNDYIKDENRCSYLADTGMVYALNIINDTYIIKPYQDMSSNIQKQVIEMLSTEWDFYTDRYIKINWNNADIFYIMTTPDQTKFIGSVAVDRKNFNPFISQLYVNPSERKKGYSYILLDIAEEYAKQFHFPTIKLWCNLDMISFYKKLGWTLIEKQDENYIMEKYI